MVKRISLLPSKQSFQVQILAGAHIYNTYKVSTRKIKKELQIEFDLNVPKEVWAIAGLLGMKGYSSYLVGGCLRDLLMKRAPKDWDIATDAKPEEIQKIFPDSIYENRFGTVGVKTRSEDPTIAVVEVTTFRKDGKYSDARHPDKVTFAKTIEEDLGRRDFTVNALALSLAEGMAAIIDPFGGLQDLKDKVICAVGEPTKRFEEDALRLMRAVRFSAQLDFEIEKDTTAAIKNKAELLSRIAEERIRDEFSKILMTDKAADGINRLEELGLLKHIIPELREGIGMGQNKHHIFTVYEHNVKALDYAAKKNYSFEVRLSCLLHDVGKSRTKRGNGPDSTFYGHQVIGERMTRDIMNRLRYSKDMTATVALLVREHMFVYDPEMVTLAGVRRLLARVGAENMADLMKLREGDRIGSGVPKAKTYRLRHLEAMVEKVKTDPIGPKMLKVNGNDLMKELGMLPGPRMGKILAVLLEETLEEPAMNDKEKLLKRAGELEKLSDKKLDELGAKAKVSAASAQDRIDEAIKKKYSV